VRGLRSKMILPAAIKRALKGVQLETVDLGDLVGDRGIKLQVGIVYLGNAALF